MDTLCQVCRRAIKHKILPGNDFGDYRHQKDISKLQQSAAERCIICTVLWNEIASRRRRQPQEAPNVNSVEELPRGPLSRFTVWPAPRSSFTLFFSIFPNGEESKRNDTIYRQFGLQCLEGRYYCQLSYFLALS